MHGTKTLSMMLLLFMFFACSGCSAPVELNDFKSDTIAVKGKSYTLRGKVKKDHDLLLNGSQVNLEPDKTFTTELTLQVGDNPIKLEVAPKKRDRDSAFRMINIRREMYPAEMEYAKATNNRMIHRGRVDDFAFDTTYSKMAVASSQRPPLLYNIATGTLLKEFSEINDNALGWNQSITFTPDNKYILVGIYWGNEMFVMDAEKLSYLKKVSINGGYGGGGSHFAISPATNAIVTSSNGIFKIDPNTFQIVGNYQPFWSVSVLAFDKSGKYLLSEVTSKKGYIKLTDTEKLQPYSDSQSLDQYYSDTEPTIAKASRIADADITAATWSDTGSEVVAGSQTGEIVSCHVNADKTLGVVGMAYLGAKVEAVALNKDKTILVASTANQMVVLDFPSLQYKMTFECGAVKTLFAPTDDQLYYGNGAGVFAASLTGIDWSLIKEYYRLKQDNII